MLTILQVAIGICFVFLLFSATAGVTDPTRDDALEILHRQFQNDYTFLGKRAKENKPFFSPATALAPINHKIET
jgi:hypothetical protein